jgi:hypothetical protein
MVKQTHKRLRKTKRKSNRRYKKNMFGGLDDISNGPLNLTDLDDLNTDEYQESELNISGISGISNYTDNEPNYLNDSFSDITETNNILDDTMNTTIDSDSILNSDGPNYYDDSNSYNGSNGSLHLSDLNISNNSLNTTREHIKGGRRKTIKTRKQSNKKTRKQSNKKNRKQSNKKNRKQRGGMCFGNGVGANSYDPNFSIYNTRELTLFPYKPTN